MDAAAEIIVQGLVQGVGFRYFVYEAARRLRVGGFARNMANGDVHIVVEGNRGMIDELIQELKVGPRAAHVKDVKVEWKQPGFHFTGFEIR